MQGRKLKEITAKANGEEPKRRWGRKVRLDETDKG